MCSADVLIHFDPKLPILIECDASPYGVGAVLSHQLPQGGARPVAYASRTLTEAERNYAQFDREALAMVFGVRHFHNYVFGQQFTVFTDHRLLLGVLGEGKGHTHDGVWSNDSVGFDSTGIQISIALPTGCKTSKCGRPQSATM